jgi:type VI secretion system protein ImpH
MLIVGMLAGKVGAGGEPGKVRIRPELSLGFPAADVAGIERLEQGYRLTATFLGLYGQASPLPTFYTEELLDEAAADQSTTRDLLDIVNHRLFTLFNACTVKYRLFFQVAQEEQKAYLERLFCLIGLGDDRLRLGLPDPRSLLRYIGLLTQYPRSALGLASFLGDALGVPVQVLQCLERRVPVPADQRLRLGVDGCSLGVDAVVGCEVLDRTGKFRLKLGPLDRHSFSAFLPGTPGRRRLDALVGFYVTAPLAWDLELMHVPCEAPSVTLGAAVGGRLGWDSWLASDQTLHDPSVLFPEQGS